MSAYYKRNRLWINPFFVGALLAVIPIIASLIIAPTSSSVPSWMTTIVLTFAGLAGGLGAAFTDTSSARAIRFIGTAFAAAVVLHAIFV